MTTNRIGALQLVRYTPMGGRLGVIPVHQMQHVSGPNGGALTVTMSEVLYGELPNEVEVAVESWSGSGWLEERDGRFSLLSLNVDKADVAGMVKISGQALVPWMGEGAFLSGVAPYAMTGLEVIGAKVLTGVSTSGSTFTKTNHNLSNGDRVRVEEAGKMNKAAVKQGGVYYVKVLGANTFQLSATFGAAVIKSVGTSSGDVKLERLRDQILAPGHQFKNGDRVSVSRADGSGLNDGSSYFIVRDGGTAFGLSNEAGGPAIELNSNTLNVFRDLDAERVFKGAQATAGYIVEKTFTEAKTRNGWGAALSEDFSGSADSAGTPWVDVIEDEPGIPIGFRPGVSLTSMLNLMVENQWAEFATVGRTLRLFNYGWGVERSLGDTPVVIGRAATAKPVKRDVTGAASHIRVRGEGNVQVDVVGTPGAFGPREAYVNASGATTKKLATSIGKQKLKTAKVLTQYAVTENAVEARFLAGRDYFRGDYIKVHVSRTSGVPERFRVVEIQKTMDAKGNVEVSTILGDRITTSALARLAARARQQSGGISSGGNGEGLPTVSTRQPGAPTVLSAESVGAFSATGAPMGSLVVTYSGVVTDIDGLDIYVDQYELSVREDGMLQGSPRGRTGGLLIEAGPFPSGRTMLVSVRARSSSGVWGPYSEEVEVVTATPIEPPLPPSQPTVSSSAGVVTLTWNGLLVDPDDGPVDPVLGFDHVYFERATDVAGAPGVFVPIGGYLGIASTYTDADVVRDGVYWYRALAVSTVGVASQPSTAVQHTVAGVGEADLDPELFLVLTSANGKNKTTFATTDPDPDPTGRTTGDLWWKRSGTVALGLWLWDGDSWESQVLADAVLGSLDVAKLVAGAATIDTAVILKLVTELLTAGRIQSQMINVGAYVPTGSTSQRVSAPLTNLVYWSQVTSGAIAYTTWGADTVGIRGVTASTLGLVLTPTATLDARLYLMQRARVPESGRVHTRLASSGGNARLWLVWFTAAGAATEVQLTNNTEFVFPATAVEYTVRVQLPANLPAETVAFATVFEAIGSGASGQQRITISPSQFAAYADDGSGLVAIGTATDEYISISKDTGAGPQVRASINSDGDFVGESFSVNDEIYARGTPMLGTDFTTVYRNEAEDVVPLLQRYANGGSYMGYFQGQAGTYTNSYKAIAYGAFQMTADRQYLFSVDVPVKVTNAGTGTFAMEVLVSDAPISVTASSGYVLLRSVLVRGGETYVNPLNFSRAIRTLVTAYTNLSLGPGLNYVMIRLRNPNNSSVEYEETNPRGTFYVMDMGPAFEDLLEISTAATSGTPTAVTALKTAEFSATWSRSWEGSTVVTDAHDYGYQNRLYQGFWDGSFAAQFGFGALGLAGKTIRACQLRLTNRQSYLASSSFPALLGTHTLASLPATRPATRDNPFTEQFRRGEERWFDVPPVLWPSIASGTIRGFTLGVDSVDYQQRAGFDGAGASRPPRLRVTYK